MERWSGKVAVVTGASAGIGLAIVRKLVSHRVTTIALSRRFQKVDDIKSELPESEAELLYSCECDVTDDEKISSTFEWIKEEFGAVHILVNNAGILNNATLLEGPIENWRKVVDVNLLAACTMTKEFFNLMTSAGIEDGHIINMNSLSGHKAPDGMAPLHLYPATKHGLLALCRTLRVELAQKKLKTKVTNISPGLVETELLEANDVIADHSVFELSLRPEDVADAVIFALSTGPNVNISDILMESVETVY